MQVLILDDDPDRTARLAQALVGRGLQTVCVDNVAMAEAVVRLGLPGLLVLAERAGGRLSHSVALLGGCRDPAIPAIFLTPRTGHAAAELFDLIPSAVSLVGPGTLPATIAELAVAALNGAPLTPEVIGSGGRVVPVGAPVTGPGRNTAEAAAGMPAAAVASRAERAQALARLPSLRPALTLA
ncbi:MAG: hypothetical protein H3C51_03970 [Rubellimicrobium sp.]|nr:hypothetical protein [Rubellimicrobium sp.]